MAVRRMANARRRRVDFTPYESGKLRRLSNRRSYDGHGPPLQHLAGLHGSEASGANERGFIVLDDAHGHGSEQVFHAAIANEGFHEPSVGEFGNNFGRDAAADVNAAGGEDFQREIRGFRAVIFNE